jgi:uncharacterized lipoprotein YmbA
MINFVRWPCILIVSLVSGCVSTAPRFYTLVPEPAADALRAPAAVFRLEVEPVRVPAQVDRLELVTRVPGGGIAIADSDRWIAPVADELQAALAVELQRSLGATDPADTARAGPASLSVRLDVERFESAPNQYALIEAYWHLHLQQGGRDTRIVCRSRAYEPVKAGYADMVRGYQRAVALIADQIGAVVRGSVGGVIATCPLAAPSLGD